MIGILEGGSTIYARPHEKIDHMSVPQRQRLMEIRQVQTDLLSEWRSPESGP